MDDRIQKVAAKAVHLGNRLETANLKRTRALEAQELMNLFRAFDEPGKISTLLPRSRTKTETNRKIRVDSDSSERGNNIDQYDNNSNDNDANNDNDNDNDNSNENDKDENDKGGKGASDGNEESTTDLVTQSKQLSIKGWQSKINTLFFSEMSNIHQAADLIQKLDFLAQELSFSDKYALAKERIDITYANIESRLHEKFALARGAGNVEEMKHIANTLYPFRNYNLCIETFVNLHRFFKGTSADFSSPLRAGSIFTDKDVFDDMANECIKVRGIFFDKHVCLSIVFSIIKL